MLATRATLFALLAIACAAPAQTRRTTTHRTAPAANDAIRNVFWQPNQLAQGSPALFTVELDRPATRVSATFVNKTITFFRDATNPTLWHALAGDDLDTQPGDFDLTITATLAGGRIAHATKSIAIAPGNFKTGDVTVPEDYVNPTDTEQKQIAADELLKRHAYARSAPHPLWSGDFIKPVRVASTPSFGESRLLNEEKTSLHTGTDFPAPEATPVALSNSGTVVLTRSLFYEGNCVIVDHGLGLFTVYMHLSRIDVHEGDQLDKGARIGLSGASGRVTGPHLHFAVRWNGAWLDPVQLLALTLPKTEPPPPAHTARRPVTHRR